MKVGFARGNAGFCNFANCKKEIGMGAVCKIEKHTHNRAEGMAFVSFFDDVLVVISDWLVVFVESLVRWEWSFTFREFQIGIVML